MREAEVSAPPKQDDEELENKLTHLKFMLERALDVFRKTEAALLDGAIDWRKLLAKAKKKA